MQRAFDGCFNYIKVYAFIFVNVFFLFFNFYHAEAQSQCSGEPEVEKYVQPGTAEAGLPVSVLIEVKGCTGELTEPIPFDGVLLIDMSDSMDDSPPQSDPHDLRIDAAISFVNCVAAATRLAIVTFSDNAQLLQDLTNNKTTLITRLNQLRGNADGSTNMYQAMELGQNHLINLGSVEREKFLILLTDGRDYSGHNEQEILDLASNASDNDLQYLNIALGDEAAIGLLSSIAFITNGRYFISDRAEDLQGVYDIICEYASHIARTRNIMLYEKITSSVGIVPGSVNSDIASLTSTQISQFETSGEIIADIGTLGSGEGKFISFEVYSNCLTPDSDAESIELEINKEYPNSKVTYLFGIYGGEVPVPSRSYTCVRPGDLRIHKNFNITDSVLTIALESRYVSGPEDRTIRNIKVIENPSYYFQPKLSSASPELTNAFPDFDTDWLSWEISEIAPSETKVLSIKLEPRVCSEKYNPPIGVNASKYTGGGPGKISYFRPTGSKNTIIMPFVNTTLPNVEICAGRPDLWVEAAFTYWEYDYPTDFNPFHVMPRHESGSILIDSEYENGFWDEITENVGDFIQGAILSSPPNPISVKVSGQGDIFNLNTANKVLVKIKNVKTLQSINIPSGAKLYVYNHSTSRWNRLGIETIPQIDPGRGFTDGDNIIFIISQNTIQSDHIRPYSLPVEDVLKIVMKLDPSLGNSIRSWSLDERNLWESLLNQGDILPGDIRRLLDDDCPYYDPFCWFTNTLKDEFQIFLDEFSDRLAWGKQSIELKVVLESVAIEKHTNNNSSFEKIIVSQ